MRRQNAILLALGMSFLAVQPSHSASSEWQDLGGGSARLIAVLDPESKRIDAAVEVKLDDGWSTYWRYPGSSGIPPRFDFSSSRGFLVETIAFPAPSIMSPDNNPYAGYKGSVTFPISGILDTAQPSQINLQLLIGVCATVCIPAQASFSIDMRDLLRSDPIVRQKIDLANLRIPEQKAADGILIDKRVVNGDKLHITINQKKPGTEPQLFVEGPMDWYLTPAKLITNADGKALFSLDVSNVPDGADIPSARLTYTLSYNSSGMEFVD